MGVVRGWGRMDLSAGWLGTRASLSGPTSSTWGSASLNPLCPRGMPCSAREASPSGADTAEVGS
jgi:hypothetical protein